MKGQTDWMDQILPATRKDYRKCPERLLLAYPTCVQAVHVTDRRGRGCVGRLMRRRGKKK